MTNRNIDVNGYMRVENNPLSKVGVFQYLGSSISDDLVPDKIYNVFRSEDELSKKECIDSFKNIPWVNEHKMLGKSLDGLTPAEKKGVHGTIGEQVYFEYPYLKGNLVVFSESLHDTIEDGKNELSCGYRCNYKKQRGSFEGQEYDFIQTDILGNHIATVAQGRMGPDVAVMDHKFTFDSKDIIMPDPTKSENKKIALDESSLKAVTDGVIAKVTEDLPKLISNAIDEKMADKDMDKKKEEFKDKGKDKDDESKDEKSKDEKPKDKESKGMDSNELSSLISRAVDAAVNPLKDDISKLSKSAMDSKSVILEMNKRDELASKVSPFIGAFDSSDKTLSEVQKYACDKLGIKADKGMEGVALDGYLHNRQPAKSYPVGAMDSMNSNILDDYLSGKEQ